MTIAEKAVLCSLLTVTLGIASASAQEVSARPAISPSPVANLASPSVLPDGRTNAPPFLDDTSDRRRELFGPGPSPDVLLGPQDPPLDDPGPETAKRKSREDLGFPGGPGAMGMGQGMPGYTATWYPSRPVSGQDATLDYVRQNLSAAFPLWRQGADALMFTLGVTETHFSTNAILPDSRKPFPSDLWNINTGLNYLHRFDNGWTAMVMTSFGSPSDEPFHSIREMNVMLGTMLRVPARNDRDMWTFGVMYSAAGVFNFPLPILGYLWNPSEQFSLSIGVPLAMNWRPSDDWTISVSYFPLTNVNARVTYKIAPGVFVYSAYDYLVESYFLADREVEEDRFFSFQQRLTTGLRYDFTKLASAELTAGYAFDRHYGEAKNQGASLHNEVDIASGAFLGLAVRMRF